MNLTESKHGRASHSETTLFFLPVQSKARSKMRSQCACLNSQLFTLVFTIYVVNKLDVKIAFICVRNLLCTWET